jgi:hypothetical protein
MRGRGGALATRAGEIGTGGGVAHERVGGGKDLASGVTGLAAGGRDACLARRAGGERGIGVGEGGGDCTGDDGDFVSP